MTSITVSTAISSGRVELVNVRERTLLTAKLRLMWVAAGFVLVAALALLRIGYLGLFESTPARQDFAASLVPPRGDIVDRNGVPLARAFPAYALWYNPAALGDDGPPLVRSARQVAAALVQIFPDMDAAQLSARLATGQPGYLDRKSVV